MRREGAVPLGIGESACDCDIPGLGIFQPGNEALMILGPVFLVNVKTGDEHGIQCSPPDTPSPGTGSGEFEKETFHSGICDHIIGCPHDGKISGDYLTGEHGTGLAKKQFLEQVAGPAGVDIMKRIKIAIDQNNILNPGKIFTISPKCEGSMPFKQEQIKDFNV